MGWGSPASPLSRHSARVSRRNSSTEHCGEAGVGPGQARQGGTGQSGSRPAVMRQAGTEADWRGQDPL